MTDSSEQVQDDLDSEAKKQVISPTVDRFVELQADFHQQLAALRELTGNWELEKDASGSSKNNHVDLFSSFDSVTSRSVQMDERLIPRIFQTGNLDKNNFTVKTQEQQQHLAPLQQPKYSSSESTRWNPWQSVEREDRELAEDETRQSKTISPIANLNQKEQVQTEINQMLLEQLRTLKALEVNREELKVNSEESKMKKVPLSEKEPDLSDKETTEKKLDTEQSVVEEIVLTGMINSSNKVSNSIDAGANKIEEATKPDEHELKGIEVITKTFPEGNILTQDSDIPSSIDHLQLSNNLTSIENPPNLEFLESSQPAAVEQFLLAMKSLPEQWLVPLTAALKILSPNETSSTHSEIQAPNENTQQQIPDDQTKKNFKNKLGTVEPLETSRDNQESNLQNSNLNQAEENHNKIPIVEAKNPEADEIKFPEETRPTQSQEQVEIDDKTKNIDANQSKTFLVKPTESDPNSTKLVRTSFQFGAVEQHSQDSLLINTEKDPREQQGNTESQTDTLHLNQNPESDQVYQNPNLANQLNHSQKKDIKPKEIESVKAFETPKTQISIVSSNFPKNKINDSNESFTATTESTTLSTNCSPTQNSELSSSKTFNNLTSIESKELKSQASNEQSESTKSKRRSSLFTVLSYFSGQNKPTSATTPTSQTEQNFSSSLSVNITNKTDNSFPQNKDEIREKITDSVTEDVNKKEVDSSSLLNTVKENSSEKEEVTPSGEELNSAIIESDLPLQIISNKNVNKNTRNTSDQLVQNLTVSSTSTEKANSFLVKVSESPTVTLNDSASLNNLIKGTSVVNPNKIVKSSKILHNPQQKKSNKILKSPSFYPAITNSKASKSRPKSPIKKVIGRRSPIKWLKKSISPKKYGIVRTIAPPRSLNKLPLLGQGEQKLRDKISRIPVAEVIKVKNIREKGDNKNKILQTNEKIEIPQNILKKKPNDTQEVNIQKENRKIESVPTNDSDESLLSKSIFPSKIPILKGSKRIPAQNVSVEIQRQIDPKVSKPSTIFPPSLSSKKMITTNHVLNNKVVSKETTLIPNVSIFEKKEEHQKVIETNLVGETKQEKNEDESSSDSEYESVSEESISMKSKIEPQESNGLQESQNVSDKDSKSVQQESEEESKEESQEESVEVSENSEEESLEDSKEEFQEESLEDSKEESQEESLEDSEEDSEEESQNESQEESSNDSLNSNESHDSLDILANADYLLEKTLNKIKAEISEYESEDKSDNENSEEITSESISTKSGKSDRNGSLMETSASSETQSETLMEQDVPLEESVEMSAVTTAKLYLMENIERESEDPSKPLLAVVKKIATTKDKGENKMSILDENEKKEKPKKRYSMVASFVQQFEGKSPRISRRKKNSVKESKQRKENSKESLVNEREVSR